MMKYATLKLQNIPELSLMKEKNVQSMNFKFLLF